MPKELQKTLPFGNKRREIIGSKGWVKFTPRESNISNVIKELIENGVLILEDAMTAFQQ